MTRMLLGLSAAGLAVVLAAGYTASRAFQSDGPPPFRGKMEEFKPTDPPVPVPETGFLDADGNKLDLSAFKGKLTLLNVWATWCVPCVEEMPSLEKLKEARAGDAFTVATISEDHQGEKVVAAFFEKNHLTALPRYVDPDAALNQDLKLEGLPTTLLIDAEGREIGRLEGGADWSGAAAARLIDWHLKHQSVGSPEMKKASAE